MRKAAMALAALCAFGRGVSAQPSSTYLDGLNAEAMSADGRVVVGQVGISAAGYWTRAGGLVNIGVPPGGWSSARTVAVSGDGSVLVVRAQYINTSSGWLWTLGAGFVPITVPGVSNVQPTCISRDGSTVGGSGTNTFARAFVWTAADGGRVLPMGENYAASVNELSPDGQRATGTASSAQGTCGARWLSTQQNCERLGLPAGQSSAIGLAMTPDASTVVGNYGASGAMVWTEQDGLSVVNPLPTYQTAILRAVSDDGSVAGGDSSNPPLNGIAMIWVRGVGAMRASDYFAARGAPLGGDERIVAISPNGRIFCGRRYLFDLGACGSADFDHDGDIGTDADIDALFRCLAGDCCPLCDSADFNYDGDVGTDADIEAFFRVLAGGAC
jgi:uncharacterized membrane protein